MRFSPVVEQSDAPSPTGRRWRPPDFVYAKPDARRHVRPPLIPVQPPVFQSPSMSSLTPSNSEACTSPPESHCSPYCSTPASKNPAEINSREPPLLPSHSKTTSKTTSSQSQRSNLGKSQDDGGSVEQKFDGPSDENIHTAPSPQLSILENKLGLETRTETENLEPFELPPPSTARYHRGSVLRWSTASRRIIPIVIALFVALSMLVVLSLLLVAQFRKIDAIIGADEDISHLRHVPNSMNKLDRRRRSLKSVSSISNPGRSNIFSKAHRDVKTLFQYYRMLASSTAPWSTTFVLVALPHRVKNETRLSIKSPPIRLQVPTSVHLQSDNIATARQLPQHDQVVPSNEFSEFVPISFPPAVNITTKLSMVDQSQAPQNLFALSNNHRASSTQGQPSPASQLFPAPTPFLEGVKTTSFLRQPLQPHTPIGNELLQSITQTATQNVNIAQTNGNVGSLKSPHMHQAPSGSLPQTLLPRPAKGNTPVTMDPHIILPPVLQPVQPSVQSPQGPHPGVPHQANAAAQNSPDQNSASHLVHNSQTSVPRTSGAIAKGAPHQIHNGFESSGSLYPGPAVDMAESQGKPNSNIGKNGLETPPRPIGAANAVMSGSGSSLSPQQNKSAVPHVQREPNSRHVHVRNIDSIEVWHLPRGRSLCRIFNAGLAGNGKIVLPLWTKQHKDFLSARCGFVDGIFGILNRGGRAEVDGKILERELSAGYELDVSHRDLDLFSPEIPRHHMPHFVSDIIRPLVATEVLMGSGRNALPTFSLLESAKDSTLVQSDNLNDDIKPSLLVDPITERGTAGQWVRHLGGFFKHPQLKFTAVPMERKGKLSSSDKMKLTLFHSILLTSVKPYEPYGLFGTSGKNIVFATNGISREPPWRMPSMREQPCRITITALTRKGPRALLNLVKLEELIKSRASAANMRADFSIVDFTEMTFEQQVRTMQETHILIATHGAGNANIIFMRPGAAFVEVFPFSYKAGPFDGFAKIFGLEYSTAMSAPQTNVFKTCMNEHEKNDVIKRMVFEQWDKAVEEHKINPWVHRLEFEKEFGEPGKSQGMTTRGCVRLQQLEFNVDAVSNTAVSAGRSQCYLARTSN